MYTYLQSHLNMYVYCKKIMIKSWFLLSDKRMHLNVGMYVFVYVCKNILIPLRKLLVPTFICSADGHFRVSCLINQKLFYPTNHGNGHSIAVSERIELTLITDAGKTVCVKALSTLSCH